MVRAHLFISGLVQGVFYRATCQREAQARGLSGWVRNLPDGRVEAVLQGPREAVEDMIRWCAKGPPRAQVSKIDLTYEPPEPGLQGFRIA
ncbi:MAG: acylphosphatase [Planctomycetota bacterium]